MNNDRIMYMVDALERRHDQYMDKTKRQTLHHREAHRQEYAAKARKRARLDQHIDDFLEE